MAGIGGKKLTVYLFIALTILFTVMGQLILKSAMLDVGAMPTNGRELVPYVIRTYLQWKVIVGMGLAFLASFFWMGAVSRSDISFAYPFMALPIVLVLLLSPAFFGERVPLARWGGVALVCVGLWVSARA